MNEQVEKIRDVIEGALVEAYDLEPLDEFILLAELIARMADRIKDLEVSIK